MSSDNDLIKLYSARILALSVEMPRVGRLADADASAKKRSPHCGSTVSVDLRVRNGRIIDFAQDVKACALGQASAAVFGKVAVGLDRAAIQRGRDQLIAMLKENGPVPEVPFSELEVLLPARDYKNRHASILLAFDATLDALDNIAA